MFINAKKNPKQGTSVFCLCFSDSLLNDEALQILQNHSAIQINHVQQASMPIIKKPYRRLPLLRETDLKAKIKEHAKNHYSHS